MKKPTDKQISANKAPSSVRGPLVGASNFRAQQGLRQEHELLRIGRELSLARPGSPAENLLLRQQTAILKAKSWGPLTDQEVWIGLKVRALVGGRRFVLSEVVDIYKSPTSGEFAYKVARLDNAGRGLNLKPVKELYPNLEN